MRNLVRRGREDRIADALEGAVEHHEIGRIDIGRQSGVVAFQDLPLGVRRYVKNGEGAAFVERPLRVRQRVGADRDLDALVGIEGLDERRLSAVRSWSTTAIGTPRSSWPR